VYARRRACRNAARASRVNIILLRAPRPNNASSPRATAVRMPDVPLYPSIRAASSMGTICSNMLLGLPPLSLLSPFGALFFNRASFSLLRAMRAGRSRLKSQRLQQSISIISSARARDRREDDMTPQRAASSNKNACDDRHHDAMRGVTEHVANERRARRLQCTVRRVWRDRPTSSISRPQAR
jgi:hypothetical protein